MKHPKEEKRSIVVAVGSYFTIQWLVQTIASWAVAVGLTALWKKFKERKNAK